MTIFLAALAAIQQVTAVVELPRDGEMRMALDAAPPELRAGAGAYRLGTHGYEKVRSSTNGFNCLVGRDSDQGLAPLCFDREGSRTLLQEELLRGRLERSGWTTDRIDAEIGRRFRDGRLKAPSRAGVAYMLSHEFTAFDAKKGRRACVYPPHVMIYAPYRTNADIGNSARDLGSMTRPWILHEGQPNAYIIVAMTRGDDARCE